MSPKGHVRLHVLCFAALNLPFLLCHPRSPLVTDPLVRSAAIDAVLFLVPGLPLASLLARSRGMGRPPLLLILLSSMATFVGVLIALRLAHVPVAADTAWDFTWALTNAAALLDAKVGGPLLHGWRLERPLLSGLLFLGAFGAFHVGAVRVVPATEDHDFELQGTVHALLTSLEPRFYTTRGTTHYFAHPPLAHLYVAGSFLYYDRWRELGLYDPPPAASPPDLDRQYANYVEHPYRLETRTPNVFLSALTVARLGGLVAMTATGPVFASLLALAYIFCPEVFVRSSYGGYFAIGNFILMEIVRAEEGRERASASAALPCLLAGAFAALADHKLMVVVAALILWEGLRGPSASPTEKAKRALRHPTLIGFVAGTAIFWLYGLAISPRSFWIDHVHQHLVDRIIHRETWNVAELGGYPGVPALWLEFARDTGWLLLPLALASFAVLGRRTAVWRGTAGFWLAWTAVTAVAFSLVDWRQTKHLVILMLPLYLAPARAAAEGRAIRLTIAVVLVVLLALNLRTLAALASDFGALVKSPEW